MSRSDRATVLRINSVGAVGAQVALGRVVVAHCAEDHEQLPHAGSERANTRVGQAPATDVGTTGREMLAAHGHHRLRSPHARPSQRRAPFPTFRHSCAPSVIPAPPPSFLRRQESRRSVRVMGTPNVRRRPITRGALVGRRPDGGSSHGWAVAWIPASAGMTDRAGVMAAHGHHRLRSPHARPSQRRAPFPPLRHSCAPSVIPAPPPSFLRRQESRRSVRVKGTPNVRRRPITRGALVGRRPDGGSSHGWAVAWIPASAGMTDRAGVTEGAEE